MKTSFGLALMPALMGVLAFGAAAQPEQPKENGHDHSAHAARGSDETAMDYFWRKSDEAFHAGDYERAVRLHKGIVALDPTDIESFSVAAWLMWSMGKSDEALAHIERGLKANERNWHMWDVAGQHYDLQKRAKPALAVKAKEAYARAVQLVPAAGKDDAQLLRRRLAHASEKADDLELSAATWRDLVRDFPSEAVNKNNLARVENLLAQQKRAALLPRGGRGGSWPSGLAESR